MWNTLRRTASVLVVLAGTAQFAQSQAAPVADTGRDTGTTVFHGAPEAVGGEFPGYGSSTPPGYTTSAGGTTVFHGAPAGAPLPRPLPPPPWASPPSASGR